METDSNSTSCSPASTPYSPQQEHKQHTLFKPPHPLHLAHLYPDYQPGHLNGITCPFDSYVDLLTYSSDRYDLTDGILVHVHEMGDNESFDCADGVAQTFRNHIRAQNLQLKFSVRVERTLDTTPHHGTSTRSRTRQKQTASSSRRPDVIIIPTAVDKQRKNLSPSSQKITCPFKLPPILTIEVTSEHSTREVDLETKLEEYAKCRVAQYIRIDRDLPHNRKDEKVIVGTLRKDSTGEYKYEDKVFRAQEQVQCRLLNRQGVTANDLIHPRSADEAAESPIRKEIAAKEEERAARKSAEEKEAKERAAKEEERAARKAAEKENAALRRQLRERERSTVVQESSSPERKKRRGKQ